MNCRISDQEADLPHAVWNHKCFRYFIRQACHGRNIGKVNAPVAFAADFHVLIQEACNGIDEFFRNWAIKICTDIIEGVPIIED